MIIKKKQKNNGVKYLLAGIFVLGIFCFSLNTIFAADSASDLKKKRDELAKKAQVYQDLIDIKKKQQNTLNNQIAIMEIEIAKLETEIELKKEEIKDINDEIERLKNQIESQEESMLRQKKIIADLLQVYYENKQEDILTSLFGARGIAFIISSEDKLTQTGNRLNEMIKNVQSIKNNLDREKQLLEEKRGDVTDIYYQLEQKNATLGNSRDQKSTLVSQTKSEQNKYQTLLNKVEQEQKDIESEIESIELYKNGQINYAELPPVKKGYFTYPVNPVKITQGYGKTSFSSHYYSGKHNGVDFGINRGNIYAAKSGKVVATGDNKKYAYGKWIAINHGDGLTTLYGHLSSFSVSKGAGVKEGQRIAISGNTGYSTGPHLHFSVFTTKSFDIVESKSVNGIMIPTGASVDPMRYLK